jgi:BA14K-like protein
MKKFLSGLCATTLAISFAAASVVPVNAAPIFVPKAPTASSDVVPVQFQQRRIMRRGGFGPSFRPGGMYRPSFRPGGIYRPGVVYGGYGGYRGDGWYRGYRGYRYYRPGYHYYDGYWFPAFLFGAIIGSALANQPSRVYGGDAHVQWCYNRYRSYRAWDNTYQPYNGPRRQCWSPYS